MKYLSIFLHLIIIAVNAQSFDSIKIRIERDSLQTFVNNPEITISLSCKNNSGKNLLLYGFEGNITKFGATIERACDVERVGGGMALLIFNQKHERVYGSWRISDSIDYKPMPQEKFEEKMNQGRLKYLKGTKVIRASSVLHVDQTIDLREFSFRRGIYYLQVIYYSGKSLKTKTVGEEQIDKDRKTHKAELFQGCAISNTITFSVL